MTYRRSPHAIWRATSDYLVVGRPGASAVEATGSAPLVWEHLARPCTLEELTDVLADATDSPRETIAADLPELLDRLVALGAVEVW